MKLSGEYHYHQDLVQQYGYQVYVLVMPPAAQHAPATLMPVTLAYIEKRYPELASEESNPQEACLNLLFVPSQLQITKDGLQQATAATAK